MRQKGKTVRGSDGLQREITTEEVEKCLAKLDRRKAAGADQIVNELMKYTGEKVCLP